MTNSLQFDIRMRPDFSTLMVNLRAGERVYAEPAAMIAMTPNLTLRAGLKGGMLKSLGRAFAGESMIVNTFTANDGPGEVTFAPGHLGDTHHHRLSGGALLLQRGAYMAHGDGVEVTATWGGARGFFSGQGLVLLKASGTGDLFFNSYGAILELDVTDGCVIDSGFIVAFEDTLSYRIGSLPGLRTSGFKKLFFSGEGLVCHFSGQGRVWIQTRHVLPFLSWINRFRPVAQSSND